MELVLFVPLNTISTGKCLLCRNIPFFYLLPHKRQLICTVILFEYVSISRKLYRELKVKILRRINGYF